MKGSYIFKVSVGPVPELLLSFNVLGSPSVTYPLAVPVVSIQNVVILKE